VLVYSYFLCLLFIVSTMLSLTILGEVALRALLSGDLTPCPASPSISAWAKFLVSQHE
jgi:hypothetical protein